MHKSFTNNYGNTSLKYFGNHTIISGDGSTAVISYSEGNTSKSKVLKIDYSSNSWTEIGNIDRNISRNSFLNHDGSKLILGIPDGLKEYSIFSDQVSETSDFSFNTSPQEAYVRAASHDLNTILVANQYMTGGEFNELTGAGNAFVYEKISSGWILRGQIIKGPAQGSSLGDIADMSADGSVIVFMVQRSESIDTGNGYTSCSYFYSDCFVYNFDGQNWIQKGSKLTFQVTQKMYK